MLSFVHKILIQDTDIINHVSLPMGIISEEDQESRNKNLRNFRAEHTRKIQAKIQWKI